MFPRSYFSSRSVLLLTLQCGYLSVRFFLPANPSDRKGTLATFLSAACSLRLMSNAACLGAASVGALSNSVIVIECFAITATVKRSHHFSHSILGSDPAVSQKAGSPVTTDGLLQVAPPISE